MTLEQIARVTVAPSRAVDVAHAAIGHEILNRVFRAQVRASNRARRAFVAFNEREGWTVLGFAFTFVAYFGVLGSI